MKEHTSLHDLSRSAPEHAPARRVPAWVIPAAIALGFSLLFAALFRDRLLPATRLEVARVLATAGEDAKPGETASTSAPGKMLFQASGWIEPDPLPIHATSLVSGVIDKVTVLEGQSIEIGELIATLIDDDAKLMLDAARQTEKRLVAAKAVHLASIETARRSLNGAKARGDAAAAMLDEMADRLKRYEGMKPGTIPETEVVAARLGVVRLEAGRLSAVAAADETEAEILRLEAETQVKEAEIQSARIAVSTAELALARTRISAPVKGRVLRLLAAPGQKKMLDSDQPDSSTVAVLYDPAKLQVRVDVPLSDAAGLRVGQAAIIRCSLLPESVFHGEVTRVTGEADLQRNTLQAKVRIDDPVDQLRPEMLCRVEFLGSDSVTSAGPAGSLATWIPESAESAGMVWVFDPDSSRVTERPVELSSERRDGYLRVTSGLRPGDQVILSPNGLSAGQRVNPISSQP